MFGTENPSYDHTEMELLVETDHGRYYAIPGKESWEYCRIVADTEQRWLETIFAVPGIDGSLLTDVDVYCHGYVDNGNEYREQGGLASIDEINVELTSYDEGIHGSSEVFRQDLYETILVHEFTHVQTKRQFAAENRPILEEGVAMLVQYMYLSPIVPGDFENRMMAARQRVRRELRDLVLISGYIRISDLLLEDQWYKYNKWVYYEGAAFSLELVEILGWEGFFEFYGDDRSWSSTPAEFNTFVHESTGLWLADFDELILIRAGLREGH